MKKHMGHPRVGNPEKPRKEQGEEPWKWREKSPTGSQVEIE